MKTQRFLVVIALLFFANTIFAQSGEFLFTIPVNGAKHINPEHTILLKSTKTITGLDESLVQLISESGNIPFHAEIKEGRMIFIRPILPFDRNTNYNLFIERGAIQYAESVSEAFSLDFTTEEKDNIELLNEYYQREYFKNLKLSSQNDVDKSMKYFSPGIENSYPAKFPEPLMENIDNPVDKQLFITPIDMMTDNYDGYVMMLDKLGIPTYFRKIDAIDFKVLPDGTLTYCNFNFLDASVQYYLIMDEQYKAIDTIWMGNGYDVDPHDILLLKNGHYLLMSYDPQIVDMSEIVEGGQPDAVVVGLVIQEVDNQQNVYFEWRSWDHMEITDAADNIDLTAENIDYVHANAFEFDTDGNLLVSQRHMDEITKINYETGDIIWRMGLLAKKNEFTFNDTIGWSHQHDIRLLLNGNYTIYDNGNLHTPTPFSQAVEYTLDQENKIATKVWSFTDDPYIFAPATGSHRRLLEDRSIIGWGMSWPRWACEVSLSGEKHFELLGPDSVFIYRATKHIWDHNVFTFNKDTLDYGEYDDYIPVSRTFKITNQFDDTIQITSSHNHLDDYWLVTSLPVSIAPGEDENMIVNFQPQGTGVFNDVLTLNYDNADTTERIARQIILSGRTKDNQAPEVVITPSHGTTEVIPEAQPGLVFDEPVKLATGEEINNENIKEAIDFRKFDPDGDEVGYSASIQGDTEIQITPDMNLDIDQPYYLAVLPDKLMDYNENVLTEIRFSYFTTGEVFGIEEFVNDKVLIYPNPVENLLNLSIDIEGEKVVKIYNYTGQKLLDVKFNDNSIQLSTSNLSVGVYNGTIEVNNKKASFRFVKK